MGSTGAAASDAALTEAAGAGAATDIGAGAAASGISQVPTAADIAAAAGSTGAAASDAALTEAAGAGASGISQVPTAAEIAGGAGGAGAAASGLSQSAVSDAALSQAAGAGASGISQVPAAEIAGGAGAGAAASGLSQSAVSDAALTEAAGAGASQVPAAEIAGGAGAAASGVSQSAVSDAALSQAANEASLASTPFQQGINSAMDAFGSISDWASKHYILSSMLGALALNKFGGSSSGSGSNTGLAPQQSGILGTYRFNPSLFKPTHVNPGNYTAQQTMFPIHAAVGGIMQAAPNYPMAHNVNNTYSNPSPQIPTPSDVTGMSGVQRFKSGDSVSDKAELLNYYESLLSPQTSSAYTSPFKDPSLSFNDQGTQGMAPQEAAMYRQNQINKRALMQGPSLNVPISGMGQVNLTPLIKQKQAEQTAIAAAQGGDESNVESSAHGGIMQAHLGHYAHGGNPRLLKGPGDGMSDNIPATIDGRQPARLATGEFVVPADVVSHMGNGDTDSGAKKLHDWMAKVREARTGNPKQGKEINADKYLPK